MIDSMLAAISGRCPACRKGQIYKTFLRPHELCPVCGVRFERWTGSWTIPVVMGYGSGAIFAFVLGFILLKADKLDGAENIIIPATLLFTGLFYPICKNISFGLMFNNGFIYPDPPRLVKEEQQEPMVSRRFEPQGPLALSPPELPELDDQEDDAPTTMESAKPKRLR
jgi:hypothetical protein